MTLIEKLLLGLQTTLIGFGLVFAILALLILIVKLIKIYVEHMPEIKACIKKVFGFILKPITYVFGKIFKKKKVVETVSVETDNGSVIAAITAAINVMLMSEYQVAAPADDCAHNGVKFRVRSIRELK